jgi:hypothetical protein
MRVIAIAILFALVPSLALAANCKRNGNAVTCDDGRAGIFAGDAIIWPDGTRSSSARHPSVHIGHKDSVRVGPGVFVGSPSGRGSVPLDDPNAPHKRDCAVLDGVSYCH